MIKKLVCVAGASLLAVAAQAATVSYTDTTTLSPTSWSKSLTLQQFDSALGTLTGVSFAYSGLISSIFKLENLDAQAANVTAQVAGNIAFSGPINKTLNASGSANKSLGAFDGNIDFGGISGAIVGPVTGAANDVYNLLGSFASYIGLGTYSIGVNAAGNSSASGSSSLLAQINTEAGASVTVTYTYDAKAPPTNPVPEPATLALAGFALAGAGLARRRRKNG